MSKFMKKSIIITITWMMCCMTFVNVRAKGLQEIPNAFEKNAVIYYTDSSNFKVLSKEEKENLDVTKLNDVKYPNTIDYSKPVEQDFPLPVAGMYVFYGSDGQVNNIYTTYKDAYFRVKTLKNDEYDFKGILTRGVDDAHFTTVGKWGPYPNILYRRINNFPYKYYGTGRATTFTDKIGQKNHVLASGDVATSLKYDNIPYGTPVYVSAPAHGSGTIKTFKMYKRDVGSLPNAIVDIWKNGVTKWGYTYSSSLSLNNATIMHND